MTTPINRIILYYIQLVFLSISIGNCQQTNQVSNKTVMAVDSSSTNSLKEWLLVERSNRTALQQQTFATKNCTAQEAKEAALLIAKDQKDYNASTLNESWQKKLFADGVYQMPIKIKTVGTAPKMGYSLYISMHGGGGTTPEANDQQWENQINLYTPKEGIYIAPRAPTNTWNLWHQDHIDALFDQIIQAAVALNNVNPNRVYLTGYSAGGDGTFQLAPRMADRFAAAAMMAGHPNETTPDGLRNLPFALYMGALDSAYDRNKVAEKWGILLDSLQKIDKEGYIHQVRLVAGRGHWMDKVDTIGFNWMGQFERNPLPNKIVWKQDDHHHTRFYWLEVPLPLAQTGQRIVVECQKNKITILENYCDSLILNLNDELVDLDKPITILYKDNLIFEGMVERRIQHIWETMQQRNDSYLVFCSRLVILKNNAVEKR